MLPDIRSGCSWRIMKMVLQFPFSLCFSHSSRSSWWRALFGGYFHFNCMEFFPLNACWFKEEGAYDYGLWNSHSHCGGDLNASQCFQYVTVEVASALLYMEDKWHALRMVVGGCGQQDCMRGSRNASQFQDIWAIFRVCFCTAPTDTSYQAPVRQNVRFLHPPWA